MSSRLLEFFGTQVVVMGLAIARGSAMNDHAVAAFAAIPLSEAKRWTAPPVDAFVMRGQGQRDIAATRGFGLTRDAPWWGPTGDPLAALTECGPTAVQSKSWPEANHRSSWRGQKSFNYDLQLNTPGYFVRKPFFTRSLSIWSAGCAVTADDL